MDLVHLLIWLAVIVIVVIAAWYILSQISLPEPINKIVMVVVVLVCAIVAIAFLMNLGGMSGSLKVP